jgi:hypothetical protein
MPDDEYTAEELLAAIERSDLEIGKCNNCQALVVTIPDGLMQYCPDCIDET